MTTISQRPVRRTHWFPGWNPEDEQFWQRHGRKVARRNLIVSVFSEHIGFSIWSIWSVLVLFLSPEIGFPFSPAQKFLLIVTPTLTGALLRLPYAIAVTRFGGRNWTVFSSAILLVPALLALFLVQRPGTPLWVFMIAGAVAGIGGGNFASSMTNISTFFPRRSQGWALGTNAGGGNLGVAIIHIVGLLVIAFAGNTHPAYIAAIYLPLIALSALFAALWMDNVDAVRARPGAVREAVHDQHTWWLSLLYVGTFGSFIGYSFAFGLVLQTEFSFTPLQSASWTFLGPLLGSLSRPLGGWLADKAGGARVTMWAFLAMAAGTGMLLIASSLGSFELFLAAFTALFVLSGLGNGSTYKMIPVVYARQAEEAVTSGADADEAFATARRRWGAVMGIAGAIGALGGVGINLAFRASYGAVASGEIAFAGFLCFYLVCMAVTWAVYLRGKSAPTPIPAVANPQRAEVRGG